MNLDRPASLLDWKPVKTISKAERKKRARNVGFERSYHFLNNYWGGGLTKRTWWCFDPDQCAGIGNHCPSCHSLICSVCGCPCSYELERMQ